MFSVFPMMKEMAETSLANQIIAPCDYYDSENLLVCGICKTHKQAIKFFADPIETDPDRQSPLKVAIPCKCETDAEEEAKRKEENEKKSKRVQLLKVKSLMDKRFVDSAFDTFKKDKFNEKNLKLCRRYATGFEEMVAKSQGLLFWGAVGTGKTHAAACIANYLMEREVPVLMVSFAKILEIINVSPEAEADLMKRLKKDKLVIFDDLGAERNTSFVHEKVYNFIDTRCGSGLPMICTTNLTLKEMSEEADTRYLRIYDRILEVCYPMQFTGPSRRKQSAYNRYEDMQRFLEGE